MPSDEYASLAGGGALRLKGGGGKIAKKHHKKKRKHQGESDLEKALSTGGERERSQSHDVEDEGRRKKSKSKGKEVAEATTTTTSGGEGEAERGSDDDEPVTVYKTEAERRFEEARRKKAREMAESAAARPELLKTHKQRVEELNTYLSKLSEHHDMPKIGPG